MNVDLAKHDLQVPVQSLGRCLATCSRKAHDKKAGCTDCDAAKGFEKSAGRPH